MYVKIKKIYNNDKCVCTQHSNRLLSNIQICIFIHTCIQKDEDKKDKKFYNDDKDISQYDVRLLFPSSPSFSIVDERSMTSFVGFISLIFTFPPNI